MFIVTPLTKYEDLPNLLTLEQAADYLGWHYETIRRAVADGDLQGVQIGKRTVIPKKIFDLRNIVRINTSSSVEIQRACKCSNNNILIQYQHDDSAVKIGISCTSCGESWHAAQDVIRSVVEGAEG